MIRDASVFYGAPVSDPARLQRATRLSNPDWLDLPGYEGTNTAVLPIGAGPGFLRLVRP